MTQRYSQGSRRFAGGVLAVALLLPFAPNALAQTPGPPPVPLGEPLSRELGEPGTPRPVAPGFELGQPKEPTLTRPAPGAEAAPPEAPAGPRVFVSEIQLSGNTVFSDAQLSEVTAPYIGRELSAADLEAVRQGLTLYYVNRGYINSGALIPDQKVEDGVVKMVIIEGELTEITVTGNERLRSGYITKRLDLGAGPPLNVNDLQEQMQIMLQGPFIKRMNAQLAPGDRPGEARLNADIEEGQRFVTRFALDNNISPPLGEARGVFRSAVYDLTGRGDVLSGEFDFGEGLRELYMDYGIPLNRRDLTFDAFMRFTDTDVVENPFSELDIEAQGRTLALRLSQPVLRSRNQQLTLAGGLDLRESQTSLLGIPFGFSPGVPDDGKVKLSVLRFIQNWNTRNRNRVIALLSTFSLGIDAFGATTNEGDLPSGEFFSWLGQIQYLQRFGKRGNQLFVRFDTQLTNDPLFTLEQFAVGGLYSVRGYRKNLEVRDKGYSGTVELRLPVVRKQTGQSLLQLIPFFDSGGSWFNDRETPEPQEVSSLGLGLRWDPDPKVRLEAYYGYALNDVPNEGDSIQDDGFNFVLTADLN
jgi:hemolysin activation/secretion protein